MTIMAIVLTYWSEVTKELQKTTPSTTNTYLFYTLHLAFTENREGLFLIIPE